MEIIMHNVRVQDICKGSFSDLMEWKRVEDTTLKYYLSCKLYINGIEGERLCITLFSEDYERPIANLIGATTKYKEEVKVGKQG